MKRIRRILGSLAGALFVTTAVTWIAVMLFEDQFIYHPTREGSWDLPQTSPVPVEEVTLRTKDGLALHAWHARAENPEYTLLWFHGNAGNITHRFPTLIDIVETQNVDVLLPDYRGFGKSEGSPDEEGLYRDADAAYEYLVAKGVPPEKIILLGISLGGGPACDLASRVPVGGLILQSAFTSLPDMVGTMIPVLPVGLLVRTKFNNLSKIAAITVPTLIIHGRQDELIPFRMGEQLHAAAAGPKTALWLEGADHNNLPQTHKNAWVAAYRKFLSELP